MELDLDKKNFKTKFGYSVGKAIDLPDPSLHIKAQEYKRRISGDMRALSPDELGKLPRSKGFIVSRKYDGENAMLFFDGEQMLSVNAGGTVRSGLPAFDEGVKLLKKAKIGSCILGAEIYLKDEPSKALPIQQVVRILRSPPSAKELSRLGVAVFDIIELNEEPVESAGEVFNNLKKWLGSGKDFHVVDFAQADKPIEIMERFTEWVIEEDAEGIVIRHDQAGWYKVKTRHNLDVAVIGFSEGSDARKGMLHDLLVAVIRKDGSFHEFARVGGGYSDEERKSIVTDLRKRIVPSEYVAVNNDYVAYEMVRPGMVIEISCLDLITERARGGPVKRMVLEWDGKRYTATVRMPLVSVISPQFVRIREDKQSVLDDAGMKQITDLANVADADKSVHENDDPLSELIERSVYTKVMKGETMVRKLMLWRTNKSDRDSFPAFVVYLTDFSPNRQNPLERDIKIANTERAAKKMFDDWSREIFLTGWEAAN
jgi:ATP-dependent DNA ligase